jgi:hypothetical protein
MRVLGAGLVAVFMLAGAARPVAAEEDLQVRVQWGEDYRTLSAEFKGHKIAYAADMLADEFPPVGAEPNMRVWKEWPVVALRAKWASSLQGWPEKYKPIASDLILMLSCDAQLYEYIFPSVVRSSRFTSPPEFVQAAQDPLQANLAELLRGKEVKYAFTAKAGFGAGDYQMTTRIRIGVSADKNTVFYHDSPQYISEYLKTRDYFFACTGAGDALRFEGVMICVCTPTLFKDTTMDRVAKSGEYFVTRMYELLKKAPTEKGIDDYLALVKDGYQSLDDYLKRHNFKAK